MPFDNTPEDKSRPPKVVVNLLRIAEAIENDVLKRPYNQDSCSQCAQAYAAHLGIPYDEICRQIMNAGQARLKRVRAKYLDVYSCTCDECRNRHRTQLAHEAVQYLLFGSNREGENRTRKEAVDLLRDVARLIEGRTFVTAK